MPNAVVVGNDTRCCTACYIWSAACRQKTFVACAGQRYNHGFAGQCLLALAQSSACLMKRPCFCAPWRVGRVQDGRLSVLRLEQLLREKITTNTTFQVKTATGGMAGGSSAISGPQQLEREVEVTHSPM